MSEANALGMLRHLYEQMVGGHVKDPERAARGLLGPAIVELERIQRERIERASPPSRRTARAERKTR